MALLALLLTFALMWLLLVRPQQRRIREHQAIISSLRVGDDVVTAGGIHGRITALEPDAVALEVAPGVELRVLRAAISQRLTPEVTDVDTVDDLDDVADEVVTGESGTALTDVTDTGPVIDDGERSSDRQAPPNEPAPRRDDA
jgi:preprotein translocase subunit YajC